MCAGSSGEHSARLCVFMATWNSDSSSTEKRAVQHAVPEQQMKCGATEKKFMKSAGETWIKTEDPLESMPVFVRKGAEEVLEYFKPI